MKKVTVVPYDPAWPKLFEALKTVYSKQLAGEEFEIEHVGSTSVPNLPAKPILDIDIIIEDIDGRKNRIIQKLIDLGYYHAGDLGIPGREALKYKESSIPNDGSGRTWPKHHLYLCMKGSLALKNHLDFRNYLRLHPEKAAAYGKLKQGLAQQFTYDIDSYIDGKTDFIVEVLRKLGMSEQDYNLIVDRNKL